MPAIHRSVETAGRARTTEPARRRGMAVAAAAVALPAVGGAVSLANGTIDMGEAIIDRFPWESVELAGVALFACVAVPFAALAVLAWRGSPRTPQATVAAGNAARGVDRPAGPRHPHTELLPPHLPRHRALLRLGGTAHGAPRARDQRTPDLGTIGPVGLLMGHGGSNRDHIHHDRCSSQARRPPRPLHVRSMR